MAACVFCEIAAGRLPADIVVQTGELLAFLDNRPLFPGHVLLIPREHHAALTELPSALVSPLFQQARLLAQAVETALEAEGTFVAMNNRVSQSVPHLHIHIVPRRRKDGLKGFFWPRRNYESSEQRSAIATRLRVAVESLMRTAVG